MHPTHTANESDTATTEHDLDDEDGFNLDGTPAPDEAAPAPTVTPSAIDMLRGKRKRIISERTQRFPVNGYSGMLWVEYRIVDYDVINKVAGTVHQSNNPRRELLGACDSLIKSCVQFYYKEGDDKDGKPNLVSLASKLSSGDEQEPPVQYDERLAGVLEISAKSARGVVLGVFENDMAILSHHNQVMSWMEGSRTEANDEFSGE